MTTYQDPPLQSRRASRQGERAEFLAPQFNPPQLPRTAAGAGEPLNYVTQNRPPLPGYDGAQNRGRRAAEPTREAAAPEPQTQSFRPRDFSPEARTAPPAWAPEYDRDTGVVDYHTHARSSVEMPDALRGSLAASLAAEPSEETLSRRELRAIRDAAGITVTSPESAPFDSAPIAYQPQQYAAPVAPAPVAQAPIAQAPVAQAPVAQAPVEPTTSRRTRRAAVEPAPEDGLASFSALYGQPVPPQVFAQPEPHQEPIQPQQYAQPEPIQQYVQPEQPQQYAQPIQPQQQPIRPQQQPIQPQQYAQPIQQPQPEQLVQPQQPQQAPQPVAQAAAPTTAERPVGHWTNQADVDESVQVSQAKVSRTVRSGALTTSALVLPSIPGHDMSTGEVLLTGSISLPSALASIGAHSPIDESDIDHLLDPGDHQMVNTDSVPIRAIKAVSSNTGSRAVITTQKPHRANRALTALIISASAMVVVVVVLLVVAIATGVL